LPRIEHMMSGTWITLEVTMGLPLRERRKLRKIERALARTEPRLTAMFSMFACLNRVEAMPRLERVRNRVIRRAARAGRAVSLRTNTALIER
jgi:hypothetical protein